MKVVVDCNVVISAGLNPGVCRRVVREISGYHKCMLSTEILREYFGVSRREKFKNSQDTLLDLVQLLVWNAFIVTPVPSPYSLPDEKDQMYLDAALSAQADILITGNKKHFPKPKYGGVRILSPREFLELMHAV